MNNVSGYFKKQTNFLLSATQPRQYPNVVFPEISFIGRSNVGKSSLINAIFMKKLAQILQLHQDSNPKKEIIGIHLFL